MSNRYGYEIKDFSQIETSNGVAFMAVLTFAGKIVLVANNSGNGGCNTYGQSGPSFTDEKDKLTAVAKQWGKDTGENNSEIEDSFVEALIRNYDQTYANIIVYEIDGSSYPNVIQVKAGATEDQIRAYLENKNPSKEIKIWNTNELKFK